MRKYILCVLAIFMSIVAAKAQDDVLLDYVWNKANDDNNVQNDISRTLVTQGDTMPTGRFKQPLKFTRAELNKIKDPRVRDMYWYALNDSTDSKRYLKAHYAFNEARDNWAVEFGGGAQTVFMMSTDDEFSLGPQFEFSFKKDLHPYWAARVVGQFSKYQKYVTTPHQSTMVDNWQDRPSKIPDEGWRQHLNYQTASLHADVMLNVINTIAGRELLYSPYDFYIYVGSGGAFSARKFGDRDGSCFVPIWLAGVKLYANITQRWSMALDLNASWQSDDLEGFTTQNSTLKAIATLGFSYKFSRVIHFQRLGYDDTMLRQQLNEAYEEGDRLATYIQNAPKNDTIVKLPADMITAAFFEIGRIELAHTYVLNLGFYSELIKNHPDQKFLVRGFADLEVGSLKKNEWLREKRAQVVADVLVKTYGVNPDQLIVGGGDLNLDLPFLREDGHHRFNRCTIVCPLTADYQYVEETEFEDKSELMDGRVKSTINHEIFKE